MISLAAHWFGSSSPSPGDKQEQKQPYDNKKQNGPHQPQSAQAPYDGSSIEANVFFMTVLDKYHQQKMMPDKSKNDTKKTCLDDDDDEDETTRTTTTKNKITENHPSILRCNNNTKIQNTPFIQPPLPPTCSPHGNLFWAPIHKPPVPTTPSTTFSSVDLSSSPAANEKDDEQRPSTPCTEIGLTDSEDDSMSLAMDGSSSQPEETPPTTPKTTTTRNRPAAMEEANVSNHQVPSNNKNTNILDQKSLGNPNQPKPKRATVTALNRVHFDETANQYHVYSVRKMEEDDQDDVCWYNKDDYLLFQQYYYDEAKSFFQSHVLKTPARAQQVQHLFSLLFQHSESLSLRRKVSKLYRRYPDFLVGLESHWLSPSCRIEAEVRKRALERAIFVRENHEASPRLVSSPRITTRTRTTTNPSSSPPTLYISNTATADTAATTPKNDHGPSPSSPVVVSIVPPPPPPQETQSPPPSQRPFTKQQRYHRRTPSWEEQQQALFQRCTGPSQQYAHVIAVALADSLLLHHAKKNRTTSCCEL